MKILITSKSFNKQSLHINKLTDAGLNVSTIVPKTEEEYLSLIDDDVVGIICGTEKITSNIINKARNLKIISRFGTGIDNISIDTAKDRGIPVLMTSIEPKEAVAELTLMLILQLYRKLPDVGNNLEDKSIGIIGYGNIGKRLEELLNPFNMTIYRYDIHTNYPLDKILKSVDIVSLHIPLNKDTFHILNKDNLCMLQKHSILINTSRRDLIDESILIPMLRNKEIRGFASDVSDISKFVGLDNAIILPHIGSFTQESRDAMESKAIDFIITGIV